MPFAVRPGPVGRVVASLLLIHAPALAGSPPVAGGPEPIGAMRRSALGSAPETSASPAPAGTVGYVDVCTLIWLHPAMKDYVAELDSFMRAPPPEAGVQEREAWHRTIHQEYRSRKQEAYDRLARIRKEIQILEIQRVRLVEDLNRKVAATAGDVKDALARKAASLDAVEESFWTEKKKITGRIEALRQEERDLYRTVNESGLEGRDKTLQRKRAIIQEIRDAIAGIAREQGLGLVLSVPTGWPASPGPGATDPTWVDPDSLRNPYQRILVPFTAGKSHPEDLRAQLVARLASWYGERSRSLAFAAGDPILAPVLVGGRDLTLPVLNRLLWKGGVKDLERELIVRYVAEVQK